MYCILFNIILVVWGSVNSVVFFSFFSFFLVDIRLEICFLRYEDEECILFIVGRYRMDVCCCFVGVVWGIEECEECFVRNIFEYEEFCFRGFGFVIKEIINGKFFFKGTVVLVVDCFFL